MKKLLLSLLALAAIAYTYAETTDCTPNATNTKNSSSTYVATETEYTVDNFSYKVNNWNPKSGQIRGNQSDITKNFYFFNTTAISNIEKIEITVSGTINADNIEFTTGSESSSLTNTGSVSFANSVITFTPGVTTDSFFKIQFKNKSTSGTVNCSKIEITYTPINSDLSPAGLAFTESEYTFTIGEEFTSPKLSNPNNLTVTFESSNVAVATVNENGQLTLKSHGQTEITATSTSTETYAVGKASYILHVIDPNVIYISELGDDFTFSNPASLEVWKHNATYGLQGSAYISSTTNAAEAIAASPEIDLTNSNSISLSFKNAFNNYKKDNTMIDVADFSGYAYVLVKEAGATDWTELCVPTAPTAFSWNFYDNDPIDLSAYSGKKIQIGFKYVSTAEVAGTWEINNIVITGKPGAVTPKPVLGAITINGTVVDQEEYTFVEGSQITFASENADEILVKITDENDVVVVDKDVTTTGTYTWTATTTGHYIVDVTTSGCDDIKNVELLVTITEKPAIDLVAEFIFAGDDANVTTMVEAGKTLDATNDSSNNMDNDLTDDVLTAGNGTTLSFTLGGKENHPKYWLSTDGKEARIYAGNDMTVTAPQGYQISKITFTKGPGKKWNLTATSGTLTDLVWTTTEIGGLNSVVFNTNTSRTDIGSIRVEIAPMTNPVAPEVPVVTIEGVEVTDFDKVIDLNESSVTVTITAPEGNYIYYKYVVQSAPAAVRAAEAANDFTLVEDNVANVTVDKNGTLYFYTHHVASGLDSDVQTLAFTGETTSLTEIEGAESAASEWYDLQGRRVARPAKGGVYIRKQGSAITKLAL